MSPKNISSSLGNTAWDLVYLVSEEAADNKPCDKTCNEKPSDNKGCDTEDKNEKHDENNNCNNRHYRQQKQTILILLRVFMFTFTLSESLQPVALLQLLQSTICTEQYDQVEIMLSNWDVCRTQHTRQELVFINGILVLLPILPEIACRFPYYKLSERKHIGRRSMLFCNSIGETFRLVWIVAVCYSRLMSVRSVWFSGVFLLLGGGSGVTRDLIESIRGDLGVGEDEHEKSFLAIAQTMANISGLAISLAVLHSQYYGITSLLVLTTNLLLARLLLAAIIPETLGFRGDQEENGIQGDQTVDGNSPSQENQSIQAGIQNILCQIKTLPPQITAKLNISLLLTTARGLFEETALQCCNFIYASSSYSTGSGILAFYEAMCGLFLLVINPLVGALFTMAAPYHGNSLIMNDIRTISCIFLTELGVVTLRGLADYPLATLPQDCLVLGVGIFAMAGGRYVPKLTAIRESGDLTPDQLSAARWLSNIGHRIFICCTAAMVNYIISLGMGASGISVSVGLYSLTFVLTTVVVARSVYLGESLRG